MVVGGAGALCVPLGCDEPKKPGLDRVKNVVQMLVGILESRHSYKIGPYIKKIVHSFSYYIL